MTEPLIVPSRCARPQVYFGLRRMGFARRTCLQVMWHGATMSIVATEDSGCEAP